MATNSYDEQDHPFRVGGLYANRIGQYEVIEIAKPKMTVRYHDGGTLVADIAILARIWENMQAPVPVPETRARPAARSTAARAAPASTTSSKPAAAPRSPRARREPKE
jgi:hypothetical protein